jgi:type I restriction enzyme S subunit
MRQALAKRRSIGVPDLGLGDIKKFEIPIPPLPEQHCIVAKIEELFSDLDAGVESLRKIQAQLKRYRQAVLKAAVEGKLTAEWRASKGKVEPASALLERIRAERAKNANGKTKPLPMVDASELPELPQGWEWTRIVEICFVVSGQTPKDLDEYAKENGLPFYKVSDMNRLGNEKFMTETAIYLDKDEINGLGVRVMDKGTIIFPKRGGAIATNKKRVLSKPSAYDLNLMGIRPVIIPWQYVYHWISAIDLETLSDESNVPQINHKDIEPLPIPLPPLAEQQQIIAEVERRLSVADAVEKTVNTSLKQAERLRQSILKRAFAGKLVPQDPSDEPAEKLLERIKAERDATVGANPRGRPVQGEHDRGKHKVLSLRGRSC